MISAFTLVELDLTPPELLPCCDSLFTNRGRSSTSMSEDDPSTIVPLPSSSLDR